MIGRFVVVQSLSHVQLFATIASKAFLSFTISECDQTHVHWVSDTFQQSHLLLPPAPPALNLSQQQGLFQWVSFLHQETKITFSFSISLSSEYSGLISFRIDWFDLLAVQGTLKSLLQHHNLKASILQCSAFFMVQIYFPLNCFLNPVVVGKDNRSGCTKVFPGGLEGKQSACNVNNPGLLPGSGRSPGKEIATHSSILSWRIPMDREAWWATVHGVTVRHDWATSLSLFTLLFFKLLNYFPLNYLIQLLWAKTIEVAAKWLPSGTFNRTKNDSAVTALFRVRRGGVSATGPWRRRTEWHCYPWASLN